ncbi:MAG TPA: DNA translocase FtsK 4TM domain-containing protein [Candidatus Saccharimonadales bacterium]|nr:DNA translocase FtsK 4TM domain-containing protein [Candidatus Saccharimonadales bacterium]
MAKKKKTTSKKRADAQVAAKSPFWKLSRGMLLIVLALLVFLGGLGTGGPGPVDIFKAFFWLFGWAAYIAPILMLFLGVYIFRDEEHNLPVNRVTGSLILLLFGSGFFYTAFASRSLSGSWTGQHGGHAGSGIGSFSLMFLDKLPAALILFVLSFLAACFVFGVSQKSVLMRIAALFKRKEHEEESELAALKAKAAADQPGFKINEGVPVVRHGEKERDIKPTKINSFKNASEKLTKDENHEALTMASDPNWQFPGLQLLNQKQDKADAGDTNSNAQIIHDTFENFNIEVEMEGANIGPRVTQYTMKPPSNVKLTKITALEDNLALDLAAQSIRIEAPIPGKRAVGIEVPNVKSATVRVSSLFQSSQWQDVKGPLALAIGKDISGIPVVTDLAKMPHLLVAGQTGSGKSVMINTILTSMLFRNSPSDLKLILVDPKQVELKPYDEIPHLLTPVITEPEKCISALKWAVAEMERRYKALSEVKKRNIAEYNDLKKEEGMPYIVIVIDELADLMMMAARDVEALIVRIAQKARAVGIHLVLATQRPSVDVITGLIKANIPARISFKTTSQIDSRTIIDQVGAEKLLGQGDLLMTLSDAPKPRRVQGALIGDDETIKIIDFLRMQRPPQYDYEVVSQPVQLNGKGGIVADYGGQDADDDMFKDAVQVVIDNRKASTSLLQRRLRIGYGRAARLIETMEEQGIVGAADGSRPREVLVNSASDIFGGGEGATTDDDYAPDTSEQETYLNK